TLPSRPVVAVVTDAVYPYHTGGKEMRYHYVLRGLAARGFSVEVHTMRWWEGPRTLEVEGVRFHALCPRLPLYRGTRRSILQAVVFAIASVRILRRRVDVIEADHMPLIPLFPLRVVAWAKRVPLVCTWHEVWGPEYWTEYLGRAGRIGAIVERLAAHLADHIVAASAETGRRLVALGIEAQRVTVAPNSVDVERIMAARPDATAPDVLFVGRLIAHKGADLLIEALIELHRRGHRTTCAIVGDGPERSRLDAMVSAGGLGGAVRVLGALESHDSIYSLMKGARVFALPSVREGFGISVLEALTCGVPVVTVDHPDNQSRWLVEHGVTGWLCPPDPSALAKGILDAFALGCHAVPVPGPGWDAVADRVAEVLHMSMSSR
ncbi:MAG TPA: glycosyltransferase family 4 protein, partial [Acidimicrobiales bacterium]|nr:glycosyltransferase family 4 protein [Acidimicrobiales bacterium]